MTGSRNIQSELGLELYVTLKYVADYLLPENIMQCQMKGFQNFWQASLSIPHQPAQECPEPPTNWTTWGLLTHQWLQSH